MRRRLPSTPPPSCGHRRAIERLAQGRTTVTIAHRLATAERADLIAVLDRGQLVELGTHADLVDVDGGTYALLYRRWLDSTAVGITHP